MGQMVALSGQKVKTGKPAPLPAYGEGAKFSRLCKSKSMGYGAWAMQDDKPITIRDLYPDMNEKELAVAEANLKRYVAVVVRIYDRLKAEDKPWPDARTFPADLTLFGVDFSIPDERSNSPKKRN
jgi:hypothetical protein